jgi:hypothetical protein
VLRLGAYQLLFGGVPAHAAVSARWPRTGRVRGFVNAILRRVAADAVVEWPDLATRLSYPDWIVARLRTELGGADAVAALERMNEPPPVTTRRTATCRTGRRSGWPNWCRPAPATGWPTLCAAPAARPPAMAEAGAFVAGLELRSGRAGLVAANARGSGSSSRRWRSSPATARGHRCAPERSTGCWSTPRAPTSGPCAGGRTPAGASSRTTSTAWSPCHAPAGGGAPLVGAGGVLVYSVCTLTAAESIDHGDGGWPVLEPAVRAVAAVRAGRPHPAAGRGHRRHDRASLPSAGMSDDAPLRAKVLTVSDGVVHGTGGPLGRGPGGALDGGPATKSWSTMAVCRRRRVRGCCAHGHVRRVRRVIVSTGGTGFAPRDLTPEGTPGRDRAGGPRAGRGHAPREPPRADCRAGIAGVRGQAIVLNTPGSPKGCVEQLGRRARRPAPRPAAARRGAHGSLDPRNTAGAADARHVT